MICVALAFHLYLVTTPGLQIVGGPYRDPATCETAGHLILAQQLRDSLGSGKPGESDQAAPSLSASEPQMSRK
jgi:hypothetical protein